MAKNFSTGFVLDAPQPGAAGDLGISSSKSISVAWLEKADLKYGRLKSELATQKLLLCIVTWKQID